MTDNAQAWTVYNSLMVDPLTHTVYSAGEEVHLPEMEYQLLYYFLQHPGQTLSRKTLMLNVPILKGRLPLPDIFLALSSLRTTYLSPPSTVKMSYPPLIRMFKTKLLSQEKKVMIPFRKQLNFG